jgi:hypothetical protein
MSISYFESLPLPVADTFEGLSGVIPSYQSVPRRSITGSQAALVSGQITLTAIEPPPGQPLSHLGFTSGGTAAVTPAHWWLVLCTLAGVVIGVTADQLATAIGTFTTFNLPMTAGLNVPSDPAGIPLTRLLVGLMVSAATVPTIEGQANPGIGNGNPVIAAAAGAALTTPPALGSNVGALSAAPAMPCLWAN